MGKQVQIFASVDRRNASSMIKQMITISHELSKLLPKLKAGGVMPKRHMVIGHSRVIVSIFINNENSSVIRFDKIGGTFSHNEARCLHDAVAAVAAIDGTTGGHTLKHVSFKLAETICDCA